MGKKFMQLVVCVHTVCVRRRVERRDEFHIVYVVCRHICQYISVCMHAVCMSCCCVYNTCVHCILCMSECVSWCVNQSPIHNAPQGP